MYYRGYAELYNPKSRLQYKYIEWWEEQLKTTGTIISALTKRWRKEQRKKKTKRELARVFIV